MNCARIYEHIHLSQDNKTSTLETLHFIDTLHEEFSIDEIKAFYREHDMRYKKILYIGEETLSLNEIFKENDHLVAALPVEQNLLEMDISEIMAVDMNTHHLTEIIDVANARKQEILTYILSQGIMCTTAAIFAILLNVEENVCVESVDFERLEVIFCTDCLVKYSMLQRSFQSSYACFLADGWRFNEMVRIADTCFIPFRMFRPFSIFSAIELYLLYLKRKTIVDEDVTEVRDLVFRIKNLQKQKVQVTDDVASWEGTGKKTESYTCQTFESLCLEKEDYVAEICRDLVGIILEKRSDNGLLETRECIESMLLLEDRDSLVYSVRRYRRQIVKYGISPPTEMHEIEDARAVLAFLESTKEKNMDLHKRSMCDDKTSKHNVVHKGLSEQCTEASVKSDMYMQCVPVLDDYSWLKEDEKAVLFEAYKEMYSPENLADLAEVCCTGNDWNVPDIRSPLRFLLNASVQSAIDTDVADAKISALTHGERIEFVHQAQSLENFKPWFCSREPTLNVSKECATMFLKKISDPIDTLYMMRKNVECLFSLAGTYDPLVLLPLISSVLERGKPSPEFIMETQGYLINTVLKDRFFGEDNLGFIKRIVDLVLCADLGKRHRVTIEKSCDEIIGLLKKFAVFFDKKIFVRNIK